MIEKLNLIWTHVDTLFRLARDENPTEESIIEDDDLLNLYLYERIGESSAVIFYVLVLWWWTLVAFTAMITCLTTKHIGRSIKSALSLE